MCNSHQPTHAHPLIHTLTHKSRPTTTRSSLKITSFWRSTEPRFRR
uniref:Uncharacterized protein n=1 Tax=Arundo donax TaxID=35708 RepID=A0A0A9A113_ARUDO